jgi:hypothetical protein
MNSLICRSNLSILVNCLIVSFFPNLSSNLGTKSSSCGSSSADSLGNEPLEDEGDSGIDLD